MLDRSEEGSNEGEYAKNRIKCSKRGKQTTKTRTSKQREETKTHERSE